MNSLINALYQNFCIKFVNNFDNFNHLNKFHFRYVVLYFQIYIFINLQKNIIFSMQFCWQDF